MLKNLTLAALTALLLTAPLDARAESEDHWIVGVLTLQHAEQCNGTWDSEWVDPHHEVGFTRLIGKKGLDLTAWEGKLVMVRGRPAPRPVVTVKSTGECPGRQARSDWIFAKNGVRLRRDWPKGYPAGFEAHEVKAFDGLTARRDGDSLHVRFTNTFPAVTLDSVELVLHYEGCYGKPNTRTHHAKLGMIKPGAYVDVELPTLSIDPDMGRGRTVHHAWTLQATCLSEGIHFVVDAPLSLFEAGAVDCPERGQRKPKTQQKTKTKTE